MAFVKVLKNKAYFSRYQVKPRRRREGKTDYQARRAMISQDKTKYNSPKYRFVVRLTNTRVICQIIYATIEGDRVICSADSTELPRYGIPVGLANFSAAYCTGLLCARRVLKQLDMDKIFTGVGEITGDDYHVEEEAEDRRPFKCILDVGLTRTTSGNRVFAAMKGAADGGIYIPHSPNRFPGFTKGENGAEDSFDAEVLKDRILGKHISNYMTEMQEDDPEKYKSHFSQYIKAGITADKLADMYKNAVKAIHADPSRQKKPARQVTRTRVGNTIKTEKSQYVRHVKLTNQQRKERVQKKIELVAQLAAQEE
ncbi:60S ribosomal protein L5 [Cryptosporidium canis]|uniref:60S ribosomal protein L5 n=1 Tax=Cryptosporidium canis TaxID=195482 RepID=A0ABQ8P8Y5_9CRYT|nr:60S ribosomal protein L5 [Cryptosporidium canis]KAJ1612843.1 60S ribosomal protein L5 [Cryptosporidium canis]